MLVGFEVPQLVLDSVTDKVWWANQKAAFENKKEGAQSENM